MTFPDWPRAWTFGTLLAMRIDWLVVTMACSIAQAQTPGISGTIHAPPGGDVRGAFVVAVPHSDGRCQVNSPKQVATRITASGKQARYALERATSGEYCVIAMKDQNENGAEGDGDLSGQYGTADRPGVVRPPIEDVDVHLRVLGAPAPYAAPNAMRSQTPASAKALPQPADDGGLDGIYIGIQQSSATGMYSEFITFFPEGRVFYDYPKSGTKPFDWGTSCANTACGNYQRTGKTLHLKWASGKRSVWTIDLDGTLRNDQGALAGGYRRLPKLDGLKLDGRFEATSVWNGETFWIAFKPDGTFSERGLAAALLFADDFEKALASAQVVEQGSGTWSINGNTLELRYGDGPSVRWGVHLPVGASLRSQAQVLYVGRAALKRVR
ncbi:MAG: hypothetical protein WBV82_28420 [Myxococcaceae bacterium]